MKKEYVKPAVTVFKLDCEAVLCGSNFTASETSESSVYEEEYSGPAM